MLRSALPILGWTFVCLLTSVACTTTSSSSCSDTGSDCTIAQTATELGFFFGSTTGGMRDWQTTRPEVAPILSEHFNSVTLENELKWGFVSQAANEYDFIEADASMAFAEQHGLRVRGHTLFWNRLNGTPTWVTDELGAATDPEARLMVLMEEHVRQVVGRYRGRIAQWDVVNEPMALAGGELDPNNIYVQIMGESFLDRAFELAHQEDPDARLFLNEVFVSFSEVTFEGLLDIVTRMLERGVPIHGVGFQGHFVVGLPDADVLQSRLQAFADLGLLVELTEVDISVNLFQGDSDPYQAQADAYAGVVRACLAVDRCTGITTWNVHDGVTWLDVSVPFSASAPHEPLLFDRNQQAKPAYFAVRDALAAELATGE